MIRVDRTYSTSFIVGVFFFLIKKKRFGKIKSDIRVMKFKKKIEKKNED